MTGPMATERSKDEGANLQKKTDGGAEDGPPPKRHNIIMASKERWRSRPNRAHRRRQKSEQSYLEPTGQQLVTEELLICLLLWGYKEAADIHMFRDEKDMRNMKEVPTPGLRRTRVSEDKFASSTPRRLLVNRLDQ